MKLINESFCLLDFVHSSSLSQQLMIAFWLVKFLLDNSGFKLTVVSKSPVALQPLAEFPIKFW